MTLVGFEPGTPGWQANVLTNTPKISSYYLVTKSQYLNLVQKVGTFLISAYPIVDSDRACSELPRTVFRSYGISKWPRFKTQDRFVLVLLDEVSRFRPLELQSSSVSSHGVVPYLYAKLIDLWVPYSFFQENVILYPYVTVTWNFGL